MREMRHRTEQIDIPSEDLPSSCTEGAVKPIETAAPILKVSSLQALTGGAVTLSGGAEAVSEPALLLTIQQAAKRLAVGRCTMQQLLMDGEVRSLKIGKLRRIPPEALEEYIERSLSA